MSYGYLPIKSEDSAFSPSAMYAQSPRIGSSVNSRRTRFGALVIIALVSLFYLSPDSVNLNTKPWTPTEGTQSELASSAAPLLDTAVVETLPITPTEELIMEPEPVISAPILETTIPETSFTEDLETPFTAPGESTFPSELVEDPLLEGEAPPQHALDDIVYELPETKPAPAPYVQDTQANASPFCKAPAPIPEYSKDAPFIVTGTAGTGTRVLYEILHANEIIMPRPMNDERDSLRFILSVKHTDPFGIPNGQMENTLVRSVSGLDYAINDVPDPARSELRQRTQMVVEDIWQDSRRDLRGKSPKRWGWKEPHSMFVLPFLQEAAPNMTIVHVVRDGRDVAFSHQQRMKYQRYYQQEFVKPKVHDDASEREISLAAARLWMKVNLETKAWAEKHIPCRYYIVRLEDLCDPEQTLIQIQRLFDQLGVSYTETSLRNSASSVLYDRCRLEKFRAQPADLVNEVEDLIAPGLNAFGYGLNKMPREVELSAAQYPNLAATLAAVAGAGRQITLTTVSDNYLQTALNWATFYAANVLKKNKKTPPLIIATPSPAVYEQLVQRGFPAYYAPLEAEQKPGQYYGYWRWRVGLLNAIVQQGYSTLVTDADAIWQKDIWNLSSDSATRLADMGDIVASRGVASSMPVALSPANVASLCMGLAYFASSTASRNLLANVNHLIRRVKIADDQVITNQLLSVAHQMQFGSESYKYGTDWSTGYSSISDLRVTLIPHDIIPRDCTRLPSEKYSNGATVESTLDARFPDAAAYHCRSAKDGINKMNMMQQNQAWRLREDWENVWMNAWPVNKPWYTAIRALDAWTS